VDPQEYEIIHQVEESHWWYQGMDALSRSLLDRWYKLGQSLQILDAGCGVGGGMSGFLADYGAVVGFDISPIALKFCREKNIQPIARASVEQIPFATQTFDLVTSFDVLYERGVKSDAAALAEFARVLKPGGRLLLRLPAYDWLRGQHDQVIHTARRYTTRKVEVLLNQAGLNVVHLTYANTFLFPLALAKRLLENFQPRQAPRSDLLFNSRPLNDLLRRILAAEAPFVSRRGFSYGLSIIAVGQKITNNNSFVISD
jgi:SAM-dependent methyltransferase